MLTLIIQDNEYKLHSNRKRQAALKRELLGTYQDSDEVVIYDGTKEIDRCKLEDLFNK